MLFTERNVTVGSGCYNVGWTTIPIALGTDTNTATQLCVHAVVYDDVRDYKSLFSLII